MARPQLVGVIRLGEWRDLASDVAWGFASENRVMMGFVAGGSPLLAVGVSTPRVWVLDHLVRRCG